MVLPSDDEALRFLQIRIVDTHVLSILSASLPPPPRLYSTLPFSVQTLSLSDASVKTRDPPEKKKSEPGTSPYTCPNAVALGRRLAPGRGGIFCRVEVQPSPAAVCSLTIEDGRSALERVWTILCSV